MKRSAVILVLVLVTACAGMPGHISERKSKSDNSAEIFMEPAFVFRDADSRDGSDLKLALCWRSNMPPNKVVLSAFVDGVHSIPNEKSLHFHIDGETVSCSSTDMIAKKEMDYGCPSYIPAPNVSSKRYVVSFEFLERIISANDVRVELDISRGDWHRVWMNGVFSDDRTGAAKPAFVRFYKRIKAQP